MEDEVEPQRREGTLIKQTSQGPIWTWVQAEGGKRGSELAREQKKTQACGVGCRDERRKLAGGGCRQCPCGQHLAPGEEVRSG